MIQTKISENSGPKYLPCCLSYLLYEQPLLHSTEATYNMAVCATLV